MFGQVNDFGNPNNNNEIVNTRRQKSNVAPGWNSNSSAWVSRLKQDEHKIGPNAIFKIMAGDIINAQVSYYYMDAVDNTGAGTLLSTLANTIAGALSGSAQSSGIKGSIVDIKDNFVANPGDLGTFLANQNAGSATPQAYLNVMFFDENFSFVPYDDITGLGSYGWRVNGAGDGQIPLVENPGSLAVVMVTGGSQAPIGGTSIGLDPANDRVKAHGVDPMTFTIGMVFFHEYGHTTYGGGPSSNSLTPTGLNGGWTDYDMRTRTPMNDIDGGANEKMRRLNKIRRQINRGSNTG